MYVVRVPWLSLMGLYCRSLRPGEVVVEVEARGVSENSMSSQV